MIGYYNSVKELENLIEQKKKEILNTAQKKKVLTNNLTSLFTKLTNHEKSVISSVSSNFTNLLAIVNAYPNLMTNNTFMDNYTQLSLLENELQNKMSDYNISVTEYNNKVTKFPDMLYAMFFGFKKKIYAEFK